MKTLTIPDEENYQQLVRLAEAAGLRVGPDGLVSKAAARDRPPVDISKLSPEEIEAILDRGGSGTSIPDPLAWQREERRERPMPFRP